MIPTKEQFIELSYAINRSIECTEGLFENMPASVQGRVEHYLEGTNYQGRISLDLEWYLECSDKFQKLPAWIWLHGDRNFISAKNRHSSDWLSDENSGSNLCKFIASSVVGDCIKFLQVRESGNASKMLLEYTPFDVFRMCHFSTFRFAIRYVKWVAGMATALSNYHYGEESERLNYRKDIVGSLIESWQAFSQSVEVAQSDPALVEFLRDAKGLRDDMGLMELAKLHKSGVLYFVGRNDETVSERLFIREVTLFHRQLFSNEPPTAGMIADLLHMDGMKFSLSERNIQRLIKATVQRDEEKIAIFHDVSEQWRQMLSKNRNTTVGQ